LECWVLFKYVYIIYYVPHSVYMCLCLESYNVKDIAKILKKTQILNQNIFFYTLLVFTTHYIYTFCTLITV
jgi:hypothetical protein